MLERQIQNYLKWMRTKEYAQGTIVKSSRVLNLLLDFAVLNQTSCEHTVSCDTLKAFQEHVQVKHAGFVLGGVSLNTVMAYRQSMGLFLPFAAREESRDRFFKLHFLTHSAIFLSTQQPQAFQEVHHAQNCQIYPG